MPFSVIGSGSRGLGKTKFAISTASRGDNIQITFKSLFRTKRSLSWLSILTL